jgi:hypothetical protein
MAFCVALMAAIFVVDSLLPLGVAAEVSYVVPVLISLWSPKRSATVWVAASCTALALFGSLLSPPGTSLGVAVTNQLFGALAIWMTAILGLERSLLLERREQLIREREEALARVRALEGILPICAWCKKIRDDAGHWSQLEVYITEHSNASFTHGICPVCLEGQRREAQQGEVRRPT